MADDLKELGKKAKDAAIDTFDLNDDGKVNMDDARVAADRVKKALHSAEAEASRVTKEAVKSGLLQDAASGAVLGAIIALPVPFVGSLFGAVVGAGIGVYRNLSH